MHSDCLHSNVIASARNHDAVMHNNGHSLDMPALLQHQRKGSKHRCRFEEEPCQRKSGSALYKRLDKVGFFGVVSEANLQSLKLTIPSTKSVKDQTVPLTLPKPGTSVAGMYADSMDRQMAWVMAM